MLVDRLGWAGEGSRFQGLGPRLVLDHGPSWHWMKALPYLLKERVWLECPCLQYSGGTLSPCFEGLTCCVYCTSAIIERQSNFSGL
jgi:hypothetical protein